LGDLLDRALECPTDGTTPTSAEGDPPTTDGAGKPCGDNCGPTSAEGDPPTADGIGEPCDLDGDSCGGETTGDPPTTDVTVTTTAALPLVLLIVGSMIVGKSEIVYLLTPPLNFVCTVVLLSGIFIIVPIICCTVIARGRSRRGRLKTLLTNAL
jgi:hypothetical protein